MAISRMQQPRQMYGLGSFVKKLTRKVTKPFTKVAKKIVPKEIAGIMRAAAPFLPSGYREAAYLLGTAKQTGRISPVDLALTAAPTFFSKTDMGRGIAQRVGDFTLPGMEKNLRELTLGAPATEGSFSNLARSPVEQTLDQAGSYFTPGKEATSGIFGKGGEFFQFGKAGGPGILDTKAGQFLLGGDEGKFSKAKLAGVGLSTLSLIQSAKTPDEAGEALVAATGNSDDYERGAQLFSSLTPELFAVPEQFRAKDGGRIGFDQGSGPNPTLERLRPPRPGPRRGLGGILDIEDFGNMIVILTEDGQRIVMPKNFEDSFIFNDTNLEDRGIIRIDPNNLLELKRDDRNIITINPDDLKDYDKMFKSLEQDPLNPRKPERAGGGMMRTNYAIGSDDPKPLPNDPTEPVNPFKPKPIGPVLPDRAKKENMKVAGGGLRGEKAQEIAMQIAEEEYGRDFYDLPFKLQMKIYEIALQMYDERGMAKGGRVNYALGTRPTAEESGLGGLPIEADMRYTGGFMPYGAKEKADDVPARLSKNEFVFTADAVRAAGGGSVNEGAKKMYATMKQLEKKPEAKGMIA